MKTNELTATDGFVMRTSTSPALRRIDAGAVVTRRDLVSITGEAVSIPAAGKYIHLQFRRFAGCPICDLHLRSIVRRHDEITRSGIEEIVVFHSSAEELAVHASDLPFAVIADPTEQLFIEFGVEASVRSLLDPRAWGAILRGVLLRLYELMLRRKSAPSLHVAGGRLGLPADFLIASKGTVVAAKHGVHAYDQWSVDTLLGLVASQETAPSLPHPQPDAGHRGVHPREKQSKP